MFADMMTSQTTAAPQPADTRPIEKEHKLEMDEEWVEVNGIRKRRKLQCKVCTIRKTVSSKRQVTRFYCPKCSNGSKRQVTRFYCPKCSNGSKRQVTRFYCPKCSNGSKRVYFCDKVRKDHYPNNNLTCYEIWHQLWRNGSERPQARCGRGIQMRCPGKKHGGIDEDANAEEEPARHTDSAADTTSEIAEDTAGPATENTAAVMREVTVVADVDTVAPDAEGTVAPGHGNEEGGNTVAADENLEGETGADVAYK